MRVLDASDMLDSVRSRTLGLAALGLVTFTLCWLSAQHFVGTPGLTAVWPANGVALAFIVRLCRGRRQALEALGVTVAGMVAANLLVGRALPVTILFPLANALEIGVAAWFLRSVAMPMAAPRDLGQFLLGGVLAGPLASTVMASVVMALVSGAPGEAVVAMGGAWFMADALGMAIVAPFLLSLDRVGRRGMVRALGVTALIFAFAFALCFQTRAPLLFLGFPIVALAVLHDRGRGGALAVGAIAAAVTVAALLGEGPAARMVEGGLDPVQVLEIYFAALVITVHPLAVAMARLDAIAADARHGRVVAEAASAAKTEILGRVGEELRSPLTGVVTVAEMLRSGRLGELNARQRDLLARIAESGAEIEALSHEMVALAGGRAPETRAVPVAEAVRAAVAACRFRARRGRIDLEVLAGDADWLTAVDGDKVKRLVRDGVLAALDASKPGDRVRVVVGLEGERTIRVTIDDAAEAAATSRAEALDARIAGDDGPMIIDRAELRRLGGDLAISVGALGGGRLVLDLPRAVAGRAAA